MAVTMKDTIKNDLKMRKIKEALASMKQVIDDKNQGGFLDICEEKTVERKEWLESTTAKTALVTLLADSTVTVALATADLNTSESKSFALFCHQAGKSQAEIDFKKAGSQCFVEQMKSACETYFEPLGSFMSGLLKTDVEAVVDLDVLKALSALVIGVVDGHPSNN